MFLMTTGGQSGVVVLVFLYSQAKCSVVKQERDPSRILTECQKM